jgi:hypothetical protein
MAQTTTALAASRARDTKGDFTGAALSARHVLSSISPNQNRKWPI